MCLDAYREALTQAHSAASSSAPASKSAPSQRQVGDTDNCRVAAADAAAEREVPMGLPKDPTLVKGEVVDQR
jgi:hypothetical protein